MRNDIYIYCCRKKWCANIEIDNRQIHLGTFTVKELAELKFDEAKLNREEVNIDCYSLNFPDLSRLIYAYENNIPIRIKFLSVIKKLKKPISQIEPCPINTIFSIIFNRGVD